MPSIVGMNAETGKPLDGLDHLFQSVSDILKTPIGTRVMRRHYGSEVPYLIDRPMNQFLPIEIFVAAHKALDIWEPRFLTRLVKIVRAVPGEMELDLSGIYKPEGRAITLQGILV